MAERASDQDGRSLRAISTRPELSCFMNNKGTYVCVKRTFSGPAARPLSPAPSKAERSSETASREDYAQADKKSSNTESRMDHNEEVRHRENDSILLADYQWVRQQRGGGISAS